MKQNTNFLISLDSKISFIIKYLHIQMITNNVNRDDYRLEDIKHSLVVLLNIWVLHKNITKMFCFFFKVLVYENSTKKWPISVIYF